MPWRLADAAGPLYTMWGTVPTPYILSDWTSGGTRSILTHSDEVERRRQKNKAGFGLVVGYEDFTADPPILISIKPDESDLNDSYIAAFGSYSQR